MEKFTVIAQVRFEIEDVDISRANRQAMASIAMLTEGRNSLPSEYPDLVAPYAVAGDFQILDESGKVLQENPYTPVGEKDDTPAE